ncbi:MAG: stage II sporulation protein P [Candidatus Paraimprobicoccus trichonymphae]|uniref:Stage II sporulation protein P n=1 Tax=Candidatus Paraimprobicoccus trichonymphae TaxID=3033793 RepID=A0AA48KW35_9FIRM|nr:MAG: stage II sporulation protein P [Candidatus Paraimprobicoccus trichonymphae]
MDVIRKSRISNFFNLLFCFFILIVSTFCFFIKLSKLYKISSKNIDKISLLISKTIFFRGKLNFNINKKISTNIINNSSKIKIQDLEPNLEVSKDNFKDIPKNPNEKTYKIIEKKICKDGEKYKNVCIKNNTDYKLDIQKLLNKKLNINIINIEKPQILIIHTHATESYLHEDKGYFYESYSPRSTNNSENVTQVGNCIAERLLSKNINLVHDKTQHDSPSFSGSYSRAAKTIKKNIEENESIKIVMDVHRDSMGNRETGKLKTFFMHKETKSAQTMLVIGGGFKEYEKNLSFAIKLQNQCEEDFPGLMRPIDFRIGRYNQDLLSDVIFILIEVGTDVNTLSEAKLAGSMIGESLAKLLENLKEG